MIKFLLAIFFLMAVTFPSGANTLESKEWGAITNHIQMSIELKGCQNEIKTNETFNLIILVKNTSTNEMFYIDSDLPDKGENWSFEVISPSGKDISPSQPIHQPFGFSTGGLVQLNPQQIMQFEYTISSYCKFDKFGQYKIAASKIMLTQLDKKPFKVVSNFIFVSVVPGYWSEAKTNNSSAWFNFPPP